MLVRSKLNSMESKMSEVLINSKNSDKDFMIIINEGTKYRELKKELE